MNQNVENLTEATKNLKIGEAKFEKWNELSPKIKLECIKTLDFKTKWNLRNTCHTERALVDSQKMKFENVKFESHFAEHLKFIEHNSVSETTIVGAYFRSLVPLLSYILDRSSFENLKILNLANAFLLKQQFIRTSPWIVKNLEMKFEENEMFHFCLDKISSKLDKITINLCYFALPANDDLLAHPKILDVPFLKIIVFRNTSFQITIAKIWIEKDVEVGRTLQVLTGDHHLVGALSNQFSSQMVSKTDEYVRIRTENPSKHILLQLSTDNLHKLDGFGMCYQMNVIPADMKESEIDKKWMDEIEKEYADYITIPDYYVSYDSDEYDGFDSDY